MGSATFGEPKYPQQHPATPTYHNKATTKEVTQERGGEEEIKEATERQGRGAGGERREEERIKHGGEM